MQSTLTPQETDPHDIFVIEPDVVLAARADKADNTSPDPVHEALSRLAQQRAPTASDISASAPSPASPPSSASTPSPTVDTTFRAAAVDTAKVPRDRTAIRRRLRSTSLAFLFALCSAIAAATWSHHREAAKQMLANWVPPSVLALLSPTATPPLAEQRAPSPTQVTTADQVSSQPAQPSDSAAPTLAAAPAESSPSVLSMARDLATMGQQIEQLKASIEQLKAGQAQMSRDIAKASEQNLRPRVAALPPRPVVAPVRKPKPAFPPAQAAASTLPPLPPAAPPALSQPAPQPQTTVESDGGPVVRPPLPLR
jgi:hypothetical protein